MLLNDLITVKRRYTRSVNLERDLQNADSVKGYILTPNIYSIVGRFLKALLTPNSVRAWTVTGVYGTGKSALAHFLASLCGRRNENVQKNALEILKQYNQSSMKAINKMPSNGLVKAIITAHREPIAATLVRGLHRGAGNFWQGVRGKKPAALMKLDSVIKKIDKGSSIENKTVLSLIKEVARASKAGLLIIVDELGKNLEYVAQQNENDLYLLQQISELPSTKQSPPIFFIGLLHQSFSDYTHSLTSVQRNEWAKIQGRFEDIPLAESPERILYLIGNALNQSDSNKYTSRINKWAKKWNSALRSNDFFKNLTSTEISSIYPLHPIAAFALPLLCNKFSQNDRTLFTFLASDEPHSFTSFLKNSSIGNGLLPSFKLHQLYDYFIESAGAITSVHRQNQRWLEIQERISDARNLDDETIQVLKTIGILNLISNSGPLRASKKIVSLAMCDYADEKSNASKWDKIITYLTKKTFVTARNQIDELRIWEGSDFDIDQEVSVHIQHLKMPLSDLLNEYYPAKPFVARRHSYETGTLRFFERHFADSIPNSVNSFNKDSDGIVFFLLDGNKSKLKNQDVTEEGKPIIVVRGTKLKPLESACQEFVALGNIEKYAKQLQTDGVARKELRQRKFIAKKILEDALFNSFNFSSNEVWVLGKKESISSEKAFNARLSDVCDKTYSKGLRLWNELINRNDLTSQGAKARRDLYIAMLNNSGKELLGLKGYGPERAMFESLLNRTCIYSNEERKWSFYPPKKESGVYEVWKTIELYCKAATKSSKPVDELFRLMENPPYGVKRGVIPVLLLSVLQYHSDYVSVYSEGSYVPILTPAYFELLVKCPDKFSIKYFEISGLREKLFKELGNVISDSSHMSGKARNATLLGVVNPLVKFVKKLPPYTLHTENVSGTAKNVRKAIMEAREPDHLLFNSLPVALGMPKLNKSSALDSGVIKQFKKKLVQALQELETAYEQVLHSSQDLIFRAFAVRSNKVRLRDDLSLRAGHLAGDVIEPLLKNFIKTASNTVYDDRRWLENVLMALIDKPVRSWTDNDVINLESKLSDIARRFRNLEAIQEKLAERPNGGIRTRKVTVMLPDGNNVVDDVVWIEESKQKTISEITGKIIKDDLNYDVTLQKAIIADLIENVFQQQEAYVKKVKVKKRKKHA